MDQKIVMVEISIQPECLHLGQSWKENKANIYRWFTKEHFDVSMPLFITTLFNLLSFTVQIRAIRMIELWIVAKK